MLPAILAGIGLNLLKRGGQVEQQIADTKMAAEQMRWSPWTGIKPGPVQKAPNAFDSILQGAAGGAMMGEMMGGEAAPTDAENLAETPQANAAFSSVLNKPQGDASQLNMASSGQPSGWLGFDYKNSSPASEKEILQAIKKLDKKSGSLSLGNSSWNNAV